jgi:hypothetical protein
LPRGDSEVDLKKILQGKLAAQWGVGRAIRRRWLLQFDKADELFSK